MTANRATAVIFLILALILAAVVIRARGPAPLPSNAPSKRFSAARAIATLGSILAGNEPHPIGARAHDLVRDRVLAQFRDLGYQTSLQQTFACNAYATCAPVSNILARLPGDVRADTLVVCAHYDSVPAGPGATDDGVGVATIIEVARAVNREHYRNNILFLITDGEEDGLIGAEGFIANPSLSRSVSAVINIDNRGTSGVSSLFETSRRNQWLMPRIARHLPRPSASSFFFNLYELLPNDTDLSVFKRAGIAGLNFACIGQVAHYHTPLDDLRHVSPSTVQDHGDHVLAMTRAMADTDLRQSPKEDAVFFDILALAMTWWPQPWTKWMATATLFVLLFGAAIRVRNRETHARAITLGVASFFLSVLAAAIAGFAVAWLATLRAPSATWVAQPEPVVTAMWLIGFATAMICATRLRPLAGVDGLFIGHGLCWIAIAIALTIVLPGGSYLALVPAAAFAICALLPAAEVSAIITSAIAAVIWFPIIFTLYDLIGRVSLAPIAALVALVSTTFTPMASVRTPMHRAAISAMLGTAIACVVMQLFVPAYTREWPRRINVQYVDDNGAARWQVDDSAPAPAPQLGLPPPQCIGSAAMLRCRSVRGAERIALRFYAPDLVSLRVNGVTPPSQPPKFRQRLAPGWHLVSVRGAPEAQIEIITRTRHPLDAEISDRSFGLPAAAAPIVRARDSRIGVPSNEGDGTVVRRRLPL